MTTSTSQTPNQWLNKLKALRVSYVMLGLFLVELAMRGSLHQITLLADRGAIGSGELIYLVDGMMIARSDLSPQEAISFTQGLSLAAGDSDEHGILTDSLAQNAMRSGDAALMAGVIANTIPRLSGERLASFVFNAHYALSGEEAEMIDGVFSSSPSKLSGRPDPLKLPDTYAGLTAAVASCSEAALKASTPDYPSEHRTLETIWSYVRSGGDRPTFHAHATPAPCMAAARVARSLAGSIPVTRYVRGQPVYKEAATAL